MLHAFFRLTEVSVKECPLSKLAKSLENKACSLADLDKPIAFSFTHRESNGTDLFGPDEVNKTRNLTDEEKNDLKEKTGWSDKQFMKCTIDDNDTIHYRTDREDLEGKESANGVKYERKTIEINGVKIEGVFPVFGSVFDTQLAPDDLQTKAYASKCNATLKLAVANAPELSSKFTSEQLKDIAEGRTPTGYVWHHNEEPGKMQLVKREDHDRVIGGAAHTGGDSLWGSDSADRTQKEEVF